MPKRIQRKRTKGWRMPPNTVYVGRGTKWGNPFKLSEGYSRKDAVWWFKQMIFVCPQYRERAKRELKGKNLACWCPLEDKNGNRIPCHADVLLRIANGSKE